jgi:single-stranded-DNA-specific exonuclease
MAAPAGSLAPAAAATLLRQPRQRYEGARDRRDAAPAGTIGALVASGARVLVISGDAILRLDQCRGRLAGFALCSWDALSEDPAIAEDHDHLVALDPPLDAEQESLLASLCEAFTVHLAWGDAELRCSSDALDRDLPLRPALIAAYRALRDGGGASEAFGRIPARSAGRMLAVLLELGVVEIGEDGAIEVPDEVAQTDLGQSDVYRDIERRVEGRRAWLNALAGPSQGQAA